MECSGHVPTSQSLCQPQAISCTGNNIYPDHWMGPLTPMAAYNVAPNVLRYISVAIHLPLSNIFLICKDASTSLVPDDFWPCSRAASDCCVPEVMQNRLLLLYKPRLWPLTTVAPAPTSHGIYRLKACIDNTWFQGPIKNIIDPIDMTLPNE